MLLDSLNGTAPENHDRDEEVEVPAEETQREVEAQSLQELLNQKEKPVSDGWTIIFHGLEEGESAYNVSDVFHVEEGDEKIPHILVRVEGNRADQEFTSRLTVWRCSPDCRECWPTSIPKLQELVAGKIVEDPAIAYVKGQPVISWVEVTPPNSPNNPSKDSTWESFSCTGESFDQLRPLVASRKGSKTKELRFVDLLERGIGVFARPDLDGRKKICFGIAKDWEDITTEFLSSLKEVQGLSVGGAWGGPDASELHTNDDIGPDQQIWGGPNNARLLPNYDISLDMHFGWYEEGNGTNGDPTEGNKKYVGGHSIIVLPEGDKPAQAKHVKVVVERKDFKNVNEPPKSPRLGEVFFLNFIETERLNSPTSIAVGSVGDAVQAGIEIPNPLLNGWLKEHPEYADAPFPQPTDQQTLAA